MKTGDKCFIGVMVGIQTDTSMVGRGRYAQADDPFFSALTDCIDSFCTICYSDK